MLDEKVVKIFDLIDIKLVAQPSDEFATPSV